MLCVMIDFSFVGDDNEEEDVCTEIKVVTENYGYENSFSFGSCNSTQEYPSYNTTIEICCQPAGTYQLVCTDTYGDGWHGGYLEVEGTSYCGDFSTGHEASHEVPMTGMLKFIDRFLLTKLIIFAPSKYKTVKILRQHVNWIL